FSLSTRFSLFPYTTLFRSFEFRNDFYPDVDDTAFVLMALQRVKYPDAKRMEGAIRRGIQWLLSMQNRDGSRLPCAWHLGISHARSEEHTSELQSPCNLVCR